MANALNKVNSGGIEDGSIVNADIKSDAAIAGSKLADDSITEVKLDVHNAPSGTDKFLAYTSNGMEWAVPTDTNTQLSFSNDANNRVVTGTGSGLNGEANLTFDGNTLSQTIASSGHGPSIKTTDDVYPQVTLGANRSSENNSLGYVVGQWNNTDVAAIDFIAGPDTTNKDDGKIGFNTKPSGSGILRRMTIDSTGDVIVEDGDLVIGTAGHGIDFSATSDASGATSEKLNDYEIGTWTPTIRGYTTAGTGSYSSQQGTYTRIGNMVTVWYYINWTDLTGSSGAMCIAGLPYNVGGSGWQQTGSVMTNQLALSNDCAGLVTHQWPGSSDMLMFYQSRTGSQTWDAVALDTYAAAIGSATYPCA